MGPRGLARLCGGGWTTSQLALEQSLAIGKLARSFLLTPEFRCVRGAMFRAEVGDFVLTWSVSDCGFSTRRRCRGRFLEGFDSTPTIPLQSA